MAYVHNQFEVIMTPRQWASDGPTAAAAVNGEYAGVYFPTAANVSTVGIAAWAPILIPHQVHAVGMLMYENGGVSITRDFTFRLNPSNSVTAVGSASDNICVLGMTPQTASVAAAGCNRPYYRRVTYSVIVQPGQYVKVLATGNVSGLLPRFALLVSPAWDVPENVTNMVSSVT